MKHKFLLTIAILMVFALAGCQSVQDKIGNAVSEKIIEGASGGKVKIDSGSGNVTVTGENGEKINMNVNEKDGTMTVQSKDGTATMGGGSKRPEAAPADMPNLDGATEFAWFGSADQGVLTFRIADGDMKAVCDKEIKALEGAGWKAPADQIAFESDYALTKNYEKEGLNLTLACSKPDEENRTDVTLTRGKKS